MASVPNGSSMHNHQAGTVQDASGDGPRVAVSHIANVSAGMTAPPDLIRPRPLAGQAAELARTSRYSRGLPTSMTTDATYRGPLTGLPFSMPAPIGHMYPPVAATVKREAIVKGEMVSQGNVANGHTPAPSSQMKEIKSSQAQHSGASNTSVPPQTPRRGRKPLATGVASSGTPSETPPAVKRKYTKKRSADDQAVGQSPSKKCQVATEGVTKRPTAVEAEERIRWNDARYDVPTTRDEAEALQEALLPTFRSFAIVSARKPPKISVWAPYGSQYRILQRCMIEHWATDQRPDEAPILAGLCAWQGSIMTWHEAKLHTREEDLLAFKHPGLQKPDLRPGTLLRFQDHARERFHRGHEGLRRQAAIQAEFKHRSLGKE